MRWLLPLHRWLGISAGWLIVLWCLSGVVMMYSDYPSLAPAQHFAGLAPLELDTRCCRLTSGPGLDADTPVYGFRLEMLRDVPRLTVDLPWGEAQVELEHGMPLAEISAAEATAVVEQYTRASGLAGAPRYLGAIERDQWTVQANFAAHRPLYHFALDDAPDTELYVSSTSGDVVQRTTRAQRFWGWLGPVTHWIYPTMLRENAALWVEVVIWTSLVGVFLTVLGLYIGIRQFRRRASARRSPYRGVALWHHYVGLASGALALTWLASGLLSVNPWGLLEGTSSAPDRDRLAALDMRLGDLADRMARLSTEALPPGTVALDSAPLDGQLYYLAYDTAGNARRLDPETLTPAPLAPAALRAAAERLAAGANIASAELLAAPDAYYYSHRVERPFPVYRVIVDDAEHTRYYLDTASGALLQKTDRARRGYRWLFEALHRLDFAPALRQRPLWDMLMLLLLAGVAAVSLTGTYMGARHLLHRGNREPRRRRMAGQRLPT